MYQQISLVEIKETINMDEMKQALKKTLYVPDLRLKPKIINKIIDYLRCLIEHKPYLELYFPEDSYRIFIAYRESEEVGFVVCQVHPTYTSYARKCGTFGWLIAEDFETCESLMKACEQFIKSKRIRKLRGPINFPKRLGGIGIQTQGFEEQMIYGVAFTDPNSHVLEYLDKLGYQRESEYWCLRVVKKTWKQGNVLDRNIRLGYLPFEEMVERKEELKEIASNSFHLVLPDTTGGDYVFNEIMNLFIQVPDSHYKLSDDFNPSAYSEIPEFLEAWESCDLEHVLTWVHIAFDRNTDEIVGIVFCLPDLYQTWLGEHISRANVDTVMVKKEYSGRGIFSSLNNIGQLTGSMNGITYFEGTSIWANNQRAVETIFPHCVPLRKFTVVQKRV